MNEILVSCIMPTANREKYIPLAIDNFLKQDYPHTDLIIIDDGLKSISASVPSQQNIKYFYRETPGTVGAKRNAACQEASGEIIMHWDDDDWYAPDWISRQVKYLLDSKCDMCGVEHVNFYNPITDTLWKGTALNRNKGYRPQWLSGATLAYWKSWWAQHPFIDANTGEDDAFITKTGAKVFAHDYIDGFIATLHPRNTTIKYFEELRHKKVVQNTHH
jgi:glycosyltransferase involved in cell wall biosynthesis